MQYRGVEQFGDIQPGSLLRPGDGAGDTDEGRGADDILCFFSGTGVLGISSVVEDEVVVVVGNASQLSSLSSSGGAFFSGDPWMSKSSNTSTDSPTKMQSKRGNGTKGPSHQRLRTRHIVS